MGITHTTAATGSDSGDGKISKNAWNEAHAGLATSILAGNGEVVDNGNGTITLYFPRRGNATKAALGAYGDECNTVSLDAAWTLRNIASVTGDGEAYPLYCDASGDGIYRSFTDPAADFEIIAHVLGAGNGGNMTGIYAVDNSGDGRGYSVYNDGVSYIWNLASYAYSSTGPGVSTATITMWDHWIHLRRTGTSWYGRWSNLGTDWSAWTSGSSDSRTITRIGFGAMYNGAGAITTRLERYVYGTPSITL